MDFFTLNQEHLIGKALKAISFYVSAKSMILIKPKIVCQLFDALWGLILNYSSEIWGNTKSNASASEINKNKMYFAITLQINHKSIPRVLIT